MIQALGYNDSGELVTLTLIYDDWYSDVWVDEHGDQYEPVRYIKETMH